MSSFSVFRILSVVLDLPERNVQSALGAHRILARPRLVVLDRNGAFTLSGKIAMS